MNALPTLPRLRRFFFTFICPTFYGGAPPAPPANTTSTVTQNSIPAELMPYATGMLSAADRQLYQHDAAGNISGFQPFKPYSTNTQDYIAPFSSLQQSSQQGAAALQTPSQFNPATAMAQAAGTQSMNAGANFAHQATDPNATAGYMSPYMQNVVAQQQREANRTYDISNTKEMGNATQQGAFGGSREALMAAENERNRNMELANIQATGTQNAFQNAQSQQQFGANLGIQGAGQATNAGATLGNIGSAELAAKQGIIGTQGTVGQTQQSQNQQAIDQAVLNYQNQQQQPYTALGTMSALLRGTPTGNLTTQNYQAQPSSMTQVGGALGTVGSLLGASQVGNNKANGGIIGYSVGGAVEADLYDMTPAQLQEVIQSATSATERSMAKRILAEKSMATGGIVGFAKGGQPWKSQLENISQEITAKNYNLHGWSDEDIKEYKTSGRVPLDPNKRLALREQHVQSNMPERPSVYKPPRTPDSEVINLPDGNTKEYKTSGRVPLNPNKKLALWEQPNMPERLSDYNPPRTPDSEAVNLLGEDIKEGEFMPREGAISKFAAANIPPIEGETMPMRGNLTEKEYAERIKAWKEARANAKPGFASAEQQAWYEKVKAQDAASAAGANDKPGVASAEQQAWYEKMKAQNAAYTAGEDAAWEMPKGIKSAVAKVGRGAKSLAKGAVKGLASTENLIGVGQDYNAEQFKEGLGTDDPATSGLHAMLGGMGVLQQLAGRDESLKEGFIKNNPRIAQKLGLVDAVAGARDAQSPTAGITTATPAPTTQAGNEVINHPSTAFGLLTSGNENQKSQATTWIKAHQPEYDAWYKQSGGVELPDQQGSEYKYTQGARQAVPTDPTTREVSKAATNAGITAPVVSNADQRAGTQVDEGYPAPPPEHSLGEYQQQLKDAYAREGIKDPDENAAEYRKRIMGQMSNAADDSKRQTYLRMAEFFSNWGSTPGAPLVAGMKALTQTMPGYLEDKKDQAKLSKALDESLYKLEEATRLEKIGDIKGAMTLKNEASEKAMSVHKLQYLAHENKLQMDSAEKIAALQRDAYISRTSAAGGSADHHAIVGYNNLLRNLEDAEKKQLAVLNDLGASPKDPKYIAAKTMHDKTLNEIESAKSKIVFLADRIAKFPQAAAPVMTEEDMGGATVAPNRLDQYDVIR